MKKALKAAHIKQKEARQGIGKDNPAGNPRDIREDAPLADQEQEETNKCYRSKLVAVGEKQIMRWISQWKKKSRESGN